MNTPLILKLTALTYVGLLAAGLLMPGIVGLRQHIGTLPKFIRQLFWVYYVFIGLSLVSFGLGTFFLADQLVSGTPLARAVCGFLAVFWTVRLVAGTFLFDLRPYLTNGWRWAGLRAANLVFACLPFVYGWVAAATPPQPSVSAISAPPLKQGESKLGQEVYLRTCAVCHGPEGRGIGQFPPVAGSEWVLAPGPNRLIRIALNGLTGPIEVLGRKFDSVEPPWRDILSDEEIAAVLTYVRTNGKWGNTATPVSPSQVKAIREPTRSRTGPWTAPELLASPERDKLCGMASNASRFSSHKRVP